MFNLQYRATRGVPSRRVVPTPRQRLPCVRWAVSRPGGSSPGDADGICTRLGVEQLKRALLLLEPNQRRTLPSAVLASGASGHRSFALQLQHGCRCVAKLGYVQLVLHAMWGVVDPASPVSRVWVDTRLTSRRVFYV
jgi:hypothetical protein